MTAILMGLLAALTWGTADFAARFTGRALGAAAALFGVMAAGSAGLIVLILAQGQALPSSLSAWAVTYGIFGLGGMLGLYEALRRGRVTQVVPLVGAFPAWSLALMVLFQGLRPSPLDWGAMAAVMAGVWMVARFSVEEDHPGAPAGRGALPIALASGAGFGIALTVGVPAAAEHGEAQALLIARMLGAILLLPLAWMQRRGQAPASPRWWALVVVQGILDTAAFLFLLMAGHGESAAAATVIGSTFGIVTIALARLVLKEQVAPLQWLGIALTFGGVAVLSV